MVEEKATEAPQGAGVVAETKTTEEAPKQEAPVTQDIPEELPKSQEEAAKAFQAMRHEIKELKEKTQEAKAPEVSAFDQLSELSGQEGEQGDLARQAIELARRADVRTQLLGVYAEHPSLNPQNKKLYDPAFEALVAVKYAESLKRGEIKELSSIVADVAETMKARVKAAEDKAVVATETAITEKEQASLEAQGSPKGEQALTAEDHEALRAKTRGSGGVTEDDRISAIQARLKNVPWSNSK